MVEPRYTSYWAQGAPGLYSYWDIVSGPRSPGLHSYWDIVYGPRSPWLYNIQLSGPRSPGLYSYWDIVYGPRSPWLYSYPAQGAPGYTAIRPKEPRVIQLSGSRSPGLYTAIGTLYPGNLLYAGLVQIVPGDKSRHSHTDLRVIFYLQCLRYKFFF